MDCSRVGLAIADSDRGVFVDEDDGENGEHAHVARRLSESSAITLITTMHSLAPSIYGPISQWRLSMFCADWQYILTSERWD